ARSLSCWPRPPWCPATGRLDEVRREGRAARLQGHGRGHRRAQSGRPRRRRDLRGHGGSRGRRQCRTRRSGPAPAPRRRLTMRLDILERGHRPLQKLQLAALRALAGDVPGPVAVMSYRREWMGKRYARFAQQTMRRAREWSIAEVELFAAFVSKL